jgi:hypothetical protein
VNAALYTAAQHALAVLGPVRGAAAARARADLERAIGGCTPAHIGPARPGWAPTVCVDFDGVIHLPHSRISHGESITGDPAPGVKAALRQLMACCCVAVHTCRPPRAAAQWIRSRLGIAAQADDGSAPLRVWTRQDRLLVTNLKIPALVYLDDRALPFTGDWEYAARMILGLIGRPEPVTATEAATPTQEMP